MATRPKYIDRYEVQALTMSHKFIIYDHLLELQLGGTWPSRYAAKQSIRKRQEIIEVTE